MTMNRSVTNREISFSSPLNLKLIQSIESHLLKKAEKKIQVIGTCSPTVVAALATHLEPWDGGNVRLIVVSSDEQMKSFIEIVRFFSPHHEIFQLPSFDVNPYSGLYPNPHLTSTRIRWLSAAQNARGGKHQLFITSMSALLQKTIPFSRLAATTKKIIKGQPLPDTIFQEMDAIGYHASTLVDEVGAYSRRGAIVDIFSPSLVFPVRIELFGDEIESIRNFDSDTQRSFEKELEEYVILPPREIIYNEDDLQNVIGRFRSTTTDRSIDSSDLEAIFYSLRQQQYFPGIEFLISQFYPQAETPLEHFCSPLTVLMVDPLEIAQVHDSYWESLKKDYSQAETVSLRPEPHQLCMNMDSLIWPEDHQIIEFSRILMSGENEFLNGEKNHFIEYSTPDFNEFRQQATALSHKTSEQISYLREKLLPLRQKEDYRIFICLHSQTNAQRLQVILDKCELETKIIESNNLNWDDLLAEQNQNLSLIHLLIGPLPQTIKLTTDKIIFLRDTDFWGQKQTRKEYKKEGSLTERTNAITFGDIKPGQFVVHKLHGVGIYEGLKMMPIQGIPTEMIHLRYKDKDSLYLPIYRIGQLQKYSGPSHTGLLDKLGTTGWEKTKTKVRKHLRDIAHDLLQLYAKRSQIVRPPFVTSNEDYFAFENAFLYEETEDQIKVMHEIEADLQKNQPMDRLLCGDVGFGKTELAMRAAFLAVSGQKQVALIAPTTVLTFQHTQTFLRRFKDWPVVIKPLNRFVGNKEITETLKQLSQGKIDIIIGTHRLLSKDVKFKNLGLMVIDEEQKFGVKHKEALRKIKTSVDTLALSATPIPRTLNMSLFGIRDLSLLNTAPLDRLPTRTFVCKFDKETIRKAILAEMNRGGQIFFIHNRVQSIYGLADELRQLVPEMRMSVAHGQMDEEVLEKTIIRFFNHELDLLLCTTIVESGIDNPRANTMFVDRADQFGLSQLYQLRGRVGRSKERAYCYLLIPPHQRLEAEAQERLRVLQENTSLGSGIKIAHYDLELRGAGDLLGEDQSGHINAVGYELYLELMEEAIREAKGETEKYEDLEPEINLRIPAFIPDKYVPDIRMRLYYYKSLSEISSPDELEKIEDELRDQFGKPPDEVLNLFGIMMIRKLCRTLGIRDLSSGPKRLSLSFTEQTPLPVHRVLELTKRENKKFALTPDSKLIIRMNDIHWPLICDELNQLIKLCPSV